MKKLFKTKIAAGILAAITSISAAAPAFAADFSDLYIKMFDNEAAIDIVYNGEILTYDDVQPQIINDRTMIPFRTVLETMGATVNYDEATRMVTATRNDTTIQFSLDSNVIDIDKNGEKSQITMDVPMAVVNDRTLVPVRFISNALGMNVGWEADIKTVVILDNEAYLEEIKALPNLGKLMTLENNIPTVENGAFTVDFDFALTSSGEYLPADLKMDARVDTAYDVTYTDGVIAGNLALNLDIDGLNSAMAASGSPVQLNNIENATINAVADEGVLYFKTDLIEKLAAAYPEIPELQSVALFADKNTWFKWDMAATFNALAAEDPAYQPMADLVNGGISGLSNLTAEDMFGFSSSFTGDATLSEIDAMETIVEMYAVMDKYITVNVEENGDYTVSMSMTEDELVTMTAEASGVEFNEEEIQMLKDAFTFNVKADGALKDGKMTGAVDYELGMNYAEGGSSIDFTFKVTATSTGDMNAQPEKPEVPSAALDVMDIVNLLQ